MQQEHDELAKELAELEDEMKDLAEREQRFWEECNDYQIKLQAFQNERDSINLKYDHDVKQYEKLQKTVVYNDAFCISHDGPFGTINGFRLGRLSSHQVKKKSSQRLQIIQNQYKEILMILHTQVSWNEINAAWGQTLLLLYTVANKLKFQFQT